MQLIRWRSFERRHSQYFSQSNGPAAGCSQPLGRGTVKAVLVRVVQCDHAFNCHVSTKFSADGQRFAC